MLKEAPVLQCCSLGQPIRWLTSQYLGMSEEKRHQHTVAWLIKDSGYGQDLNPAPHCGVWALAHKAVLCPLLKENIWTLNVRKKPAQGIGKQKMKRGQNKRDFSFSFKSNHRGSVALQIYEKIQSTSVFPGLILWLRDFWPTFPNLLKCWGIDSTMRPHVPAGQLDHKIICVKTDPGMPFWNCHEKWMNNGKIYSSASFNLYKQYNFDVIRKFMQMVKLSIIESTQSKWLNWQHTECLASMYFIICIHICRIGMNESEHFPLDKVFHHFP